VLHSFSDCIVTDLLSLHGRILSIKPDLFVVSHQFIAKRREHDEVVSILRQHGVKEEEPSRGEQNCCKQKPKKSDKPHFSEAEKDRN